MGVTAQLKVLSALKDQINTANVDTTTKETLNKKVEDVKDEIEAYKNDVVFYRIVVSALGLAIIMIIIAVTFLLYNEIKGFDALTAIGSASIGGLVGLLAPSPVGQK